MSSDQRYYWKTKMQLLSLSLLALLALSGACSRIHENYGTIIGIDLGNTNAVVGVSKDGRVEIIPNDRGSSTTPSYVAFTNNGQVLVGEEAKDLIIDNPQNTIFDIKHLIGRNWDDPVVQSNLNHWPFTVVNVNNRPYVQVIVGENMKQFSPEELAAMVLTKTKEITEAYLGKNITSAVVTVPAYFNDAQRRATWDAGALAGLRVIRIINEPIAAAVAYGLDTKRGGERNVVVYDLGGSTLDVTLLTVDNGVFEVLATSGDPHLGGQDFDQRVVEHFVKLYKKKTGKDLRGSNEAVHMLRREVEKAKRTLSSAKETRIKIDSLFDDDDFSEILTRATFERLNKDLFLSSIQQITKVLEYGDLGKGNVDDLMLIGGSTNIPKVQQMVKEYFEQKEPFRGINSDEAVAYGAAKQAEILSDEKDEVFYIWDVNPITLGVETSGGVMTGIISKNMLFPTSKSQIFSTAADNQPTVTIQVFEGERPMTKDNHQLGKFDLTGILPAPRGTPQIEVTFEIDVNGILKVSAEDKGTGNKNNIVINNDQNRLSPEDMEHMMNDAEKFAEEDKKVKERVEARNELEGYAYSLKNQIADKEKGLGSKLSESEKKEIEDLVSQKIEWLVTNQEADEASFKEHKKQLEVIMSMFCTEPCGNDWMLNGAGRQVLHLGFNEMARLDYSKPPLIGCD